MVRTDDGMRGTVELVAIPGFEGETEKRVVYLDRGERRVAGKREVWEPEKEPPRKLRVAEIVQVAWFADRALQALDRNQPFHFWQTPSGDDVPHDPGLVDAITDYLNKRA